MERCSVGILQCWWSQINIAVSELVIPALTLHASQTCMIQAKVCRHHFDRQKPLIMCNHLKRLGQQNSKGKERMWYIERLVSSCDQCKVKAR